MKYEVNNTKPSIKSVTKYGKGMYVYDIVTELNSVESIKTDLAKVTAERDEYRKFHTENLPLISWIARETVSVQIDGDIKSRFDFYLAKRDLEQQANAIETVHKYSVQMLRNWWHKWSILDAIWHLKVTEKELRKQSNEVGK